MDPNECLKRWREAYASGNKPKAAGEARDDLASWLNKGGFWPSGMTEDEIFVLRKYHNVKVALPVNYIYG